MIENPTFLIKFFYKDSSMKELKIQADTMSLAVKIAIDTVGGYIPWNEIKVEKV